MGTNQRFRDNGEELCNFTEEILVVCPKCSGLCFITVDPQSGKPEYNFQHKRRAVCGTCGYSKTADIKDWLCGDGIDPYFGLPLWLQASCCGKLLWAFNKGHLDFLKGYVEARIRQEIPNKNRSMASRLPAWIKKASNRQDLLSCLEALQAKLQNLA
jgi:hypothetical protein